jgi:hypothetical protein
MRLRQRPLNSRFAGTIWQGVIPRRDRDQMLLTYLVSGFSRDYADAVVAMGGQRPTAEQVLEVSYAIYLTANYTIQPDLQYIIRPNGTNEVKNSVVLGVQFTANFYLSQSTFGVRLLTRRQVSAFFEIQFAGSENWDLIHPFDSAGDPQHRKTICQESLPNLLWRKVLGCQ